MTDIPGYEGLYQIYPDGRVFSFLTDRFLKQRAAGGGYLYVRLYYEHRKWRNHKIHRLVAETFLENPENKPQVDHIDGNRKNNDISNLRWATLSENQRNRRMSSKNTSGFKGVRLDKKWNRWTARIKVNGIEKHIGAYTTAEEASAAYKATARMIYGEFYRET